MLVPRKREDGNVAEHCRGGCRDEKYHDAGLVALARSARTVGGVPPAFLETPYEGETMSVTSIILGVICGAVLEMTISRISRARSRARR